MPFKSPSNKNTTCSHQFVATLLAGDARPLPFHPLAGHESGSACFVDAQVKTAKASHRLRMLLHSTARFLPFPASMSVHVPCEAQPLRCPAPWPWHEWISPNVEAVIHAYWNRPPHRRLVAKNFALPQSGENLFFKFLQAPATTCNGTRVAPKETERPLELGKGASAILVLVVNMAFFAWQTLLLRV